MGRAAAAAAALAYLIQSSAGKAGRHLAMHRTEQT